MGDFGYPFSVPFGDPDDIVQINAVRKTTASYACEAFAKPGWGGFNWAIYVDDSFYSIVTLLEGVTEYFSVTPHDFNKLLHSFSLEAIGNWSFVPSNTAVGSAHFQYEEDFGDTVLVQWTANQNYLVVGDLTAALSAWSLTGLRRAKNVATADVATRSKLNVTVTQSGADNTVQLLLGAQVVASGVRTGDGVVTLTEQNDSGLSGTVTVAYTSDVSAVLLARWPKTYTIAVTGGETFTVNDDGLANKFEFKIVGLAPATYTVTITPMSDTGQAHTATVIPSIVVQDVPDPTAFIALQAAPGDYLATNIEWLPSYTAGVTYEVYDSALDEPTIVTASIASPAVTTLTLPAIALGAGKRRVIVESKKAGIESGARQSITIEYDAAGAIVLLRPNIVRYSLIDVTAGWTVNFRYEYDRTEARGNATKVAAFIVTEANLAAFDASGVADATIALPNEVVTFASGSVAGLADGVRYLFVLAEKADGTRGVLDKTKGIRVWLDNDTEAAITGSTEVAI